MEYETATAFLMLVPMAAWVGWTLAHLLNRIEALEKREEQHGSK